MISHHSNVSLCINFATTGNVFCINNIYLSANLSIEVTIAEVNCGHMAKLSSSLASCNRTLKSYCSRTCWRWKWEALHCMFHTAMTVNIMVFRLLDQEPFKFWHMRIDTRVRSMCLHHLHVGVLPVSMHDIYLMMNTQYSGSDLKYKACFNGPYLHACTNFLVKQPENLCMV